MYQVIKRDGAVTDFNINKISAAIQKAFDAQGKQSHPSIIDMLALRVTSDFETKIQAAVSDGFVSWIMQYGDRVKVVSPQHMIDKVKCKAYSVLSNYKTLM